MHGLDFFVHWTWERRVGGDCFCEGPLHRLMSSKFGSGLLIDESEAMFSTEASVKNF